MNDKIKLSVWDDFTQGYLPVDVEKVIEAIRNMEFYLLDKDEEKDNYYAFPGGVEVKDISAHLTSFGGQALQYVARATRLDGKNKGEQVKDLTKAIDFIQWEIERLENETI